MKQYNHQRYCPNGHLVEDEELNYCPECGMPLTDHVEADDSYNSAIKATRYVSDESSKHNKNNIGYIILSTVILALLFVILELTDVTYLIPQMHKKVQMEQLVAEVVAAMKTQENNVGEVAEPMKTEASNTDEVAVMMNAAIEQSTELSVMNVAIEKSTEPPAIPKYTYLYCNPNGGRMYHADQYCKGVAIKHLPLQEFLCAEINEEPYNKLIPCRICLAPSREEIEAGGYLEKNTEDTNTDETRSYEIYGL